jgi:hypothetical protein
VDRDPLAEAAARGQRAQLCDEFIGPILKEVRGGYMDRMAEIAATELNPKARSEKITALSIALKVLGNVENGLNSAIEAGKVAQQSILKADKIERMGVSERRLLDIVPRF